MGYAFLGGSPVSIPASPALAPRTLRRPAPRITQMKHHAFNDLTFTQLMYIYFTQPASCTGIIIAALDTATEACYAAVPFAVRPDLS